MSQRTMVTRLNSNAYELDIPRYLVLSFFTVPGGNLSGCTLDFLSNYPMWDYLLTPLLICFDVSPAFCTSSSTLLSLIYLFYMIFGILLF